MNTPSDMKRTQIYLHATQQSALAEMARSLRSTSSALIRQSIDEFMKAHKPADQRARRMLAAGSWSDNPDVLDLAELRREERQF